jgi:hypothetical protein
MKIGVLFEHLKKVENAEMKKTEVIEKRLDTIRSLLTELTDATHINAIHIETLSCLY